MSKPIMLTAEDKTQSLTAWAKEKGICTRTLYARYRHGCSDLFAKPRPRKPTSYYSFRGIKKTIYAWAKEYGMNAATLAHRLKQGWTMRQALTLKRQPRNVPITHQGKTQTLHQWSAETGIKYETIWMRIRNGKEPFQSGLIPDITFNGKTQPLRDWANDLNISYQTLWCRYRKGWPMERVFKNADCVRR